MGNFADLPTELLLQILQARQLKDLDLYAVGLVSKRLNTVAIPLYLNSKSIVITEGALNLTFDAEPQPTRYRRDQPARRLDALSGLRVALFLTTVLELQCTFSQEWWDPPAIQPYLVRIASLIARLAEVKSLVLIFEGDTKLRDMHADPDHAVPPAFAAVLGDILVSLETRGCEKVSLFNKSYFLHQWEHDLEDRDGALDGEVFSHSPSREYHAKKKRKGIKGAFTRAKTRVEAVLSDLKGISNKPPPLPPKNFYALYPSFISNPDGACSSVHTLHIQTPFALLPQCFPATQHLIHASMHTLTSLTLSYIFFDVETFDSCLSALSSHGPNSITHLTISHCREISSDTLLGFVRCFQDRLQNLELDPDIGFASPHDESELSAVPNFPRLQNLTAPIDWVTQLLPCPSRRVDEKSDSVDSPPLPQLRSLIIQPRTSKTIHFTYQDFNPILDSILQNLYSRSQASTLPNHKVDVTLDLKLQPHRPWQMDLDRSVFMLQSSQPIRNWEYPSSTYPGRSQKPQLHSPSPNLPPQVPPHWNLITRLILSPTAPPTNSIHATLLARWVTTLFPAVQEVRLSLPSVLRLSPSPEIQRSEKALVDVAVALLVEALRETRVDEEPFPVEWRILTVGPWTFPLDLQCRV
ncbi:hypothetical protein B0H34DRAFT_727622 [Crassisporium funariophilum]|nr:hypothetical protein B0H34DRAFT_727622 [Crassisporium funariophilum]